MHLTSRPQLGASRGGGDSRQPPLGNLRLALGGGFGLERQWASRRTKPAVFLGLPQNTIQSGVWSGWRARAPTCPSKCYCQPYVMTIKELRGECRQAQRRCYFNLPVPTFVCSRLVCLHYPSQISKGHPQDNTLQHAPPKTDRHQSPVSPPDHPVPLNHRRATLGDPDKPVPVQRECAPRQRWQPRRRH
jgi:hypothetical protein